MNTWGTVVRRGIVIAVALSSTVAACADPENQSLCTVYDRFQETAANLETVSLDGTNAGKAADRVEDLRGRVRHLDAVADTRYSDQLDQLEDALDNLLRVLESIPEDADPATWQPLVEDSADEARRESLVVIGLIEPACAARDDG